MYVRASILSAVLIAVSFTHAQTQSSSQPLQSCPIRIDKWGDAWSASNIAYTNASDKATEAVIMRVTGVNDLGEEQVDSTLIKRDYNCEYDLDGKKDRLAPGEAHKDRFDDVGGCRWGNTRKHKLFVYGVRFQDGTVWKDDGSHSCAVIK